MWWFDSLQLLRSCSVVTSQSRETSENVPPILCGRHSETPQLWGVGGWEPCAGELVGFGLWPVRHHWRQRTDEPAPARKAFIPLQRPLWPRSRLTLFWDIELLLHPTGYHSEEELREEGSDEHGGLGDRVGHEDFLLLSPHCAHHFLGHLHRVNAVGQLPAKDWEHGPGGCSQFRSPAMKMHVCIFNGRAPWRSAVLLPDPGKGTSPSSLCCCFVCWLISSLAPS